MCLIQYGDDSIGIRNGADVFIRDLFIGFGSRSESIYAFVLLCSILIIMYYNREVIRNGNLKEHQY